MEKKKTEETNVLTNEQIQRFAILHKLIKSGKYPNIQDISRAYKNANLGVADITIRRDIHYLNTRFGADIAFDRIHDGYYYNYDFNLPFTTVSAKDAFYLSCVKKLLQNFENSPLYDSIQNAIELVTFSELGTKHTMLDRIAVLPSPQTVVDEKIWNTVMEALQENILIVFDYNGRWHTQTSRRRVRPYQLLLTDGVYYLFGYDELASSGKGGERLFRLNRMKNIIKCEKTFKLPENYDFASQCSGGKFGAFVSAEKEKYKIDFYGSSRQYVKDCVWADDQIVIDDEEKGTTTITFTSSQSLNILEWILSQGGNAKPIKPKWLVERWEKTILTLAQRIKAGE